MTLKWLLAICGLLMACGTGHAASAPPGVTGEIVGQGGQRFPIAVSPLKNLAGNSAESARLSTGIADAMVHDLELSGWFKVLDRSAYMENAQTSGITLGTFDFKDWATIGAEGLVKGGFSVQGDEVASSFIYLMCTRTRSASVSVTRAGSETIGALPISSSTKSSINLPACRGSSIPESPTCRTAAAVSRRSSSRTSMAVKNFKSPIITQLIYLRPGVPTAVPFFILLSRTVIKLYFCLSSTAAKRPNSRPEGAAGISAASFHRMVRPSSRPWSRVAIPIFICSIEAAT
jgi:TolB amino-terminal domain.